MNGLDLFSGIGGLSLALRDYVRPVAYCEIDAYCQGVLFSRMADGFLPVCPIWDDIRTLQADCFKSVVDIIYGGFPCQDISVAGRGKGLEGERSGLFFEILRLAEEIKPKFIFLENVPAITSRGGLQVVREITSMGYDCKWCVISAASVGANHKRERWFLLAYSNSKPSIKTDQISKSKQDEERTWLRYSRQDRRDLSPSYWQKNKCPIPGMDDVVSFRVDRAKALGNAVCVEQAREAFKELIGIKNGNRNEK